MQVISFILLSRNKKPYEFISVTFRRHYIAPLQDAYSAVASASHGEGQQSPYKSTGANENSLNVQASYHQTINTTSGGPIVNFNSVVSTEYYPAIPQINVTVSPQSLFNDTRGASYIVIIYFLIFVTYRYFK